MRDDDEHVRSTAEQVARRSYGKLISFLAARTRDVAGAEDALSEAFAAALNGWPSSGVPSNPEAWLLTVARRRMIDAARLRRTADDGSAYLQLITDEAEAATTGDGGIPDDRLRLMFACAHPAIDAAVRAPLILQTILGFDAGAIASAFLVSPATMGQRLVRAKGKIRQAGIPFSVPDRSALQDRLGAVLEAIYAVFAEGWTDPAGTEARRRNLAEEGIWLGHLVASLLPGEPEALGLLALMLHAEARRGARRDGQGDYVPLAEQNTALWDARLINEAEALLLSASRTNAIGRYQLEAAAQSAHAIRRLTGSADWNAIVEIYDTLYAMTGSPVVAINRAVALAEVCGAREGIAALDAIADDRRLAEYQPYWAARADLLSRVGESDAAAEAYRHAIGLEPDASVRRFLQRRCDAQESMQNDSR